MSDSEPQLAPIFDFLSNDPEVILRTGQVKARIGDDTFQGRGEVVLALLPRPRLLLRGDIEHVPMEIMLKSCVPAEETDIEEFHFNDLEIDGFSGGPPGSIGGESNQVVWHPNSEPLVGVGGDCTSVTKIVFHLFNFRDFKAFGGTSETRDRTTVAIQKIALESCGLKVRIKSLFESDDNFKQLRREGGSRITHVGSLQLTDESSFTGKQALVYLAQLKQLLSFVNGKRCIPVCPCGFDSNNDRVWEAWSSPGSDSGWTDSWFDTMHCDQLGTFFKGYLKVTRNETWKTALSDSMYWYLNANASSRGNDAGIILTQAALEILAYTYVVVDKSLLSQEGFKKLWASDQLRLLFNSIGIPTSIPSGCERITSLVGKRNDQFKWEDLPHALTEIRNSLIHPEKKNREKLSGAYVDAWKAGLWCLELAILRLCGYSGTYSNRMKRRTVGDVEDVPWSFDSRG